jgi:hypothetical protein
MKYKSYKLDNPLSGIAAKKLKILQNILISLKICPMRVLEVF